MNHLYYSITNGISDVLVYLDETFESYNHLTSLLFHSLLHFAFHPESDPRRTSTTNPKACLKMNSLSKRLFPKQFTVQVLLTAKRKYVGATQLTV